MTQVTAEPKPAPPADAPETWGPPKSQPELAPEPLARWRAATDAFRAIARAEGWSRSEAARRADIPHGTLTPLIDGAYTGNYGNQVAKLERWLENREEVRRRVMPLPEEPGYFETPTSRELTDVLLYAQQATQMVVATLGSGMGKTTTAEAFRSRSGVYMATMRPTTRRPHGMLQEVAAALEVDERQVSKLDRAIGLKIRRGGRPTLLMIDEAQHLSLEAVDQLRYFRDVYRCGIALIGNDDVYLRFGRGDGREGFGQIQSRIGMRFRRLQPSARDIEVTLDAWNVEDATVRRLLAAIGRKPGALRELVETFKLASMIAAGAGAALAGEHVKQAWSNRSGEEARP